MCGIAGILNFNYQPVAHSQIKKMTDVIVYRGPDGQGEYIDRNIGLGHRRLAIIDLTPAGHQPMQTKNGRYVITYNGEIYNYQSIRTELESLGYQFHSNTDTEVVLNAYAEWGEKALHKFNGMFAFAIWDKECRQLFVARDRYGIKPLYYYLTDQVFVFASEIKAIIASGLYQADMDTEGLVEYLTFQNFFTDKTLFKDIKVLMPGYCAVIKENGQFHRTQYWDFRFESTLKASQPEVIEEVDRLFTQAVQRQLISDVPVNAYLSGGIDSGAISMIASQFLPHMKTFTVGFDLSSASGLELSFDERKRAEHISYLAKTEHYEMVLKAGDMERCMDKYVYHLEEPRVGQSYPNFYASKLASKFGKVVLAGTGGDEIFGGYPWRYHYPSGAESISFDQFIDDYYLKWQRLIPNASLKKLLSPIWGDVKHVWTRDIFKDVFTPIKKGSLNKEDCFNYSLYLEAKTFLHGLLSVEDKLSMAHGLETRVPFLDNDLVDFALTIPMSLKVTNQPTHASENDLLSKYKAGRKGKVILRKALSKYLDKEITDARKQGFSSPDASWFRGESVDYVRNILKNSLLVHEKIMDNTILNKYVDEHIHGIYNHRLFIWSFLNLESIMRKFFKSSPS